MVFCDDDGDGADKVGPGCCAQGDPACDCDDNDNDVYPGQTAWFDVARPGVQDSVLKWDYNCNGIADKEYIHFVDPCNGALGLCAQTGDSFNGNQDVYDCGVMGILTNCQNLVGGCQAQAETLACH